MASQVTVQELRGLGLPAIKGPGGYFQTRTAADVAWSDLMIAIFTPRGARPMNREFGSLLHEQLFEPQSAVASQSIIDYLIRSAVDAHCPHIRTEAVEVVSAEGRELRILIEFSLRSDETDVQRREIRIDQSYISAGGA
tara:strand:+ start:4071 stop:4487 length:417 start_codon:yes stop_codon:yes gene_type:complete